MREFGFQIEKINDAIYVARHPRLCNIGICIKNGSGMVIEAGRLPKKAALLKKIVEKDFSCRIELVFVTHYHNDHTFGGQSFKCPIISSELCRVAMQNALLTHWTADELAGAIEEEPELAEEWKDLEISMPTETFDDERYFEFKGITVVFQRMGGHTDDSSIAYFPEYRLLFAGDIVFGERYPTLLQHDGNPVELVEALRKIEKMDVDIIVPGHGSNCGRAMVRHLAAYWDGLISESRRLINSGETEEDIIEQLLGRYLLPDLPEDRMRHRRNICSVLRYVKNRVA
jgi:glyoxylase-like metal-dependent hydrolase (beta-lactamase superfamily II)